MACTLLSDSHSFAYACTLTILKIQIWAFQNIPLLPFSSSSRVVELSVDSLTWDPSLLPFEAMERAENQENYN